MKYVVILGDGMADYRQEILGNKTPLMVAKKPYTDSLSKISEVGLCQTVPCGMKPGSDVANLSVLGYDPKEGYTGRSPLEAASIGIDLKDTDVTARANLVTVSNEEEYQDKTMIDYSAGEISTAEAKELIEYLAKELNTDKLSLYAGISYRHCLVIDNGKVYGKLTPPHDITGQPVKGHLPDGDGEFYLDLMKRSYELLKDHPINIKRISQGKNPANSLWFWGEGTKPSLQSFESRFNLKGGIISAVDLLKGIGKLTGMQVIEVEGATGNYDTNFSGKAKACIDALNSGLDFVYIHMEAPDECGHHGDVEKKIFSIEEIDEKVVKTVVESLKNSGEDFAVLIAPDHPTPIAIRTHCSDPVPYLIYDSRKEKGVGAKSYDEEEAKNSGIFVEHGYELIQRLMGNK
ncbi:MAG: cofactor-independent phosphoglycerate mutase [Clostridiales bacterium]|nr:cofactor-independent phosphoglycerate mutase [Clostridiales bacterium]